MLVGEVFARMGLDSKQYEESLDRLENATKKRALTLGNIFKGALSVTIGMTMFEAVKRGFQIITSTAISFNAQMEQARMGFATMLGSAERAEVFLSDMAEFAAKTPFEFTELLDASKRMLAYGFAAEDVLPTMEAVGNATAALGLGAQGIDRIILALGQMRAKGKLSGEEMRQLTEAGIPAWEMLAEVMGKTTAEIMDMQSKGLIPADRAIKMLVEGMNKRFPNMMAQMENTWEGVTSTIKDVWRMTIGAVTQNLFQGVVSWLQKVRDFAVGFYDTFQKYGLQRAISESFGPEVAAMVSVLGATLRGLASVVSAVTGFITQYGKQIKFVTVVMGTYLALTKAVTLAKQIMIAVTAVERGQLLAKIPILNVVSTAMGIYRVQMALAAQQGIVLTGVLAKLRVALFSLWSALGPIGWIILGLSVAVGVGTHLWGKYTQSVYDGATAHQELAEGAEQAGGSAGDAAGAIGDEADALKKAGKAADKNLQSFDEVHQLQEDMAVSAEDLAESMRFDDTELGAPEVGGLEIPDIEEQLEEMKPTLAGFWEWIKQGAGNIWEGVKERWNSFTDWVKSWKIWTTLKEKWGEVKEWAGNIWEGVKEKWNSFTEWVKSWGIWSTLKEKWSGFKEGAGNLWEGVKEKWNGFEDWLGEWWENSVKPWFTKEKWLELFDNIRKAIKEKWDEIKNWWANTALVKWWDEHVSPWFTKEKWLGLYQSMKDGIQEKWAEIKDWWKNNAFSKWWQDDVSPWFTKEKWLGLYQSMKDSIQEKWREIKDWWKNNTLVEWWSEDVAPWFTKEKWKSLYDNIKTSIQEKWKEVKDWWNSATLVKWWDEDVKPWFTWDKWKEVYSTIKDALIETWDEIKNSPIEWGRNLIEGFIKGIKEKWEGVKTVIKDAVNGIIGFINKFIRGWNNIELKVPEIDIPLVGTVGGWSVHLPQISEIPMLAKGGLVTDPTLAMLGEAGPEAVVPLGRSGFAEDLADTVARAVYQAIMDAARISRASADGNSREIVLKIDNTTLARMQLPAIIREGQRQGLNLVVQPQGV